MTEDNSNTNFNLPLTKVLTEREKYVFNELSQGKTNKEIAKALFVSVNTIKTHVKNIYSKLNVHNRTQAVKEINTLKNNINL